MEQDVFAVLQNEGWTLFKSIPVISTLPGKHILAEFSIPLCILAYETVKLENSWLVFRSDLRSNRSYPSRGYPSLPHPGTIQSRQVSTVREADTKARS